MAGEGTVVERFGEGEFRHAIDAWSIVLPLSRLRAWVRFHMKQRRRNPQAYEADCRALLGFYCSLRAERGRA